MKKAIIAAVTLLLGASVAMAWAPTKMQLSAPEVVTYGFDGSLLNIPITVTGVGGTGYLCVYSKDKGSTIVGVQNGLNNWHYVNKIDTAIYISGGISLTTGSQSVTWDGNSTVTFDKTRPAGGQVPTGTYTYYLFAYNSAGAKEMVNETLGTQVGGGGRSCRIQTTGPGGITKAQPEWYNPSLNFATGTRYVRKWVIGSDPVNASALETTSCSALAGFNGISYCPAIDPGDSSKFFVRVVNEGSTSGTGLQGIAKYTWAANGVATVDASWAGESQGVVTWQNNTNSGFITPKDKLSGPSIIGDYIYCSNTGVGSTEAQPVGLMAIDRNDGTGAGAPMWDLSSWWVNNGYEGIMKNGGPNGVIECGDNLILNSHMSCMRQLVNPNAESSSEFRIWQSANGDGFLEKNEGVAGKEWVCFDTGVAPYTYTAFPDAKGFVAVTSYTPENSTSFVLLGPDGTGIDNCSYGNALMGVKAFSVFVDTDGAYDGIYCDDLPTVGIWYVGQDSFQGTITPPPPPGVTQTVPAAFTVSQNSPNPFNPTTTITFKLAKAGKTTVDVFNAAGQKVDTIVNGTMSAGSHSVTWNAAKFSAGVYFYTVKSGSFSKTMKMTLLK